MLHDYPKSETKISIVNSVPKLMMGHMDQKLDCRCVFPQVNSCLMFV